MTTSEIQPCRYCGENIREVTDGSFVHEVEASANNPHMCSQIAITVCLPRNSPFGIKIRATADEMLSGYFLAAYMEPAAKQLRMELQNRLDHKVA